MLVSFSRPLRFEPLEDRRLLANVTVGNLNDVVNGNVTSIADLIASDGGDGISLREAILAANADAAADMIDFSVTGTIQLTNVGHAGEIAITRDVSISGPGAGLLTVRAFDPSATLGDGARIFNVFNPFFGTSTVAISGLTLTGGDVASSYGGGAILNSENLTITNSTITGNNAGTTNQTFRGGGIANNGGNLSVIASTISGNTSTGSGAGIDSNLGSLTIAQSTISGNATRLTSGGGIRTNSTTTTIDSSTISGNSAFGAGGGIYVGGGGSMTITNSTISGNSARSIGGGIFASSTLIVRHSTITLNRSDSDNSGSESGGGLSGPATLDHMIVAGNLRSTSTRDDIAGTVTARYSLIGDNTGATITDNGGNQIGTGATPIDGRLAPLVNNGGPTSTHAFLPGSPAVDAGDPVFSPPPTNDQRGMPFARVADGDGVGGARIDVGAYEQQTTAAVSIIVDTLADENDGNSSTGDLSLREAISVANNSVGLDTITFAASLTSGGPATILLTLGELVVFDSLTIQGPGAHLLTIDASGNDPTPTTNDSLGTRVFAVDDGSVTTMIEVAIIGLTLTGGDAPTFGGGIFNSEHLILANSTISGNSVGFRLGEEYAPHGGGIFNRGNMTIDGSTISGNNARSVGGGIQNDSNLTIVGSTISGNFAGLEFSQPQAGVEPYGGGIFNSGSLTVRHSTITANNASTFPASLGTGEGIFNHFVGDLTLDHTIVAGNDPGHAGGSNIAGRGLVFANFSIIGGSIGLGPLADNGGPTFTHALLPGSPAIDVGDPNFDPADPDGDPLTDDAVPYDQRGAPFVRVAGGRIDIGAYERQTVADLNLVVDTTADEEDGDYSPGNLSLREAIDLANGFVGADTITFAAALSGATITLRGTELELAIGEALVIDARPLDANVIIDANELSRIFHITAFTGDFTLGGLTLTGGRMGSAGGAIRSFTFGNLTLDQSTVSGNSTTGNGASGGGIDAFGALTLVQSTVRGNSTAGDNAYGGGISARTATLIQSTISGNSTAGDNAPGGGISAGTVMVTQSTVSGNSTAGDNAHGGGISAGTVTLTQSTVTENHALDGSSLGGGVFQVNFGNNFPFTISGSIVAGNTALAGGPDLVPDPQSTLTVNYSLIGTGIVPTAGGNNVATNNPQLAPLANNGGPTLTHALLAGSPAIDAGDPNFDPADPDGDPQTDDAAPYDQRGDPYTRVFDGDGAGSARIDTGAFELIADDALHALFGDYNGNGVVDAADYTKWRDTLGQLGVDPYSGADGNGDGMIGPEDRQVWVDHFGQSVPPLGAGSGQQFVAPPAAASFASAATPNQGGKAEGGRGKEETSARGAVPFAVSLSINPTARVFAVRPRPDAAVRLSAVARTDAGLLAWLASRDDARRAMDSADGEDAIADRSGDARSESGLDLLDGVFRALLGGAV